jgi:anti-sigma factor RsiW
MMKHVDAQLPAFVAGVLSAADRAAVQQHLADCPICARECARMSRLWDVLGEAATPVDLPRRSAWEAVRARTIEGAHPRRGRIGPWGRTGIAAMALAAGLSLAILLPAGGRIGSDSSTASATTWGSGFWLDDPTSNTFSDLWLDAAEEGDRS